MPKLTIEIDSQETGDGFTKSLHAANEYEAAILQLITGEQELARNEEKLASQNAAIDHFNKMTAAEKEAYLASHQMEEANKSQGFSFTELNSAIGIATQIYGVLKGVLDETYGTYSKNIEAVRDLALISGTSAEETSRFIQVLDDYQLSAQDAEVATKKLKDNGMTPTIDTLAKLADAYKLIKDPAEKMQFIQDNLGKGGAAWVNVLNQSSDALRANAAATNENLIFSDKQVADYEKQRLALDALSDTWEGYKNKVGEAIGNAILLSSETQKATEIMHEQGIATGFGYQNTKEFAAALQQVKDSEKVAADATAQGTEEYEKQSKALKDAEKAAKEAAKAIEASAMSVVQAGIAGTVTQAYDNLSQKTQKLKTDHADLESQLQTLSAQGWQSTSQKVQDLTSKLNDNEQAQKDVAKATQDTINKMIFQQASAGLDAKSTLELARAMGMIDEQSYAVASATEALHKQFLDGKISADEYAKKVAALRDTVNDLHDKDIKITATTVMIGADALENLQNSTVRVNQKGGGKQQQQMATGGTFEIPSSYGNEGFQMGNDTTASAGETVTITPKGKSAGGDMSGVIAAINNNRINEASLARMIVTAMKRGV